MIVDRLDNAGAYHALGPRLAAALRFLQENDVTAFKDGRYDIDGDDVFVLVQRYRTKSLSQAVWESHRNYIDVQYVAQGEERLGYVPLAANPTVTKPYDASMDAALYQATGSMLDVTAGTFLIFTPQDVHAPGLAAGSPPLPA